jgi:hypothetical protein
MKMNKYIPEHKGDIDKIELISALPFLKLKIISKELLEWLQDLHWPVSKPIANILKPYTNNLKEEIIEILKSNDDLWKYNIIICFFMEGNIKLDNTLKIELQKITNNPTQSEKEEEVDKIAQEALAKKKIWT